MTRDEIKAIVDGIETQGEGFGVFHELIAKFGWSGTVFCLDDLREHITNCREDDGLPELTEDELDEWVNDLTTSYEWRKGLAEHLAEAGWELIGMAYTDLLAEKTK